MSSLVQFLSHLQSLNLSLSVEGDRLICSAPKNALTPELRQQLAERKAEILEFLRPSATAPTNVNLRQGSGTEAISLSRAQQRLWFLDQVDPGNPAYNVTVALELSGSLDRHTLARTLQEIIARHDVLRISIHNEQGIPRPRIGAAQGWHLNYVDLQYKTAGERGEAEALSLACQQARQPFDLSCGPLVRAALFGITAESHLLVLTMHHIVADGWSLGILSRELSAIYAAFRQGLPSPLPPLTYQYADYVRWEEQDAAANYQRDLDYWRQQLGGDLPVIELPSDRGRPALPAYRGRRVPLQLGRDLTDRLRALSREQGATPFMLLLAAFQVLLSRYTGLEDIPIGTPIAGRTREEFSGLIGLFVNSLVLRTDLSGDPRFVDLLARVKQVALRAYEHQSVPFDRLVEYLQPRRNLAQSPLFQVTFALQNVPLPQTSLPGLQVRVREIDPEISRYDLSIEIWDRPAGYQCDFEYSTELYSEATIQRLQDHYLAVLTGIATDPYQRLSDLPLLSAAERRRLVTDWNQTASPYPPYGSVPEWFRAQAQRVPGAVAVVADGQALTYQELDKRSDALGSVLRQQGAGAGSIVAVCLDRSPNLLVALLAILKSGAAYLPLDAALPAERLARLQADSQARLVVTQQRYRANLSGSPAQVLCIDGNLLSETTVDLGTPAPDDLAYLIYTSGSTGTPKGVAVTHRSLVNLLASIQREPGLTESDTLLAVSSLSFDVAAAELFLPLVTGGQLALASRETVLDPPQLAALLEKTGATVMEATPSIWRVLVESGWAGKADLKMLTVGEPLTPDLARQLTARGRELWNLYGPTETTIYSLIHKVTPGEDPVLIGRPIANTRIYILDAHGSPVPEGVTGELVIAGDGVARGYWRRPELTAERFVSEAPLTGQDRPMYRTGDLARYRSNGEVQCLGRRDQQVKLRGHRIELGEIEAILEQHESVREVAVLLHEQAAESALVAYVTSVAPDAVTAADLRGWLHAKLPEYMVPAGYVFLDALPLTPNGKVDRQKLKEIRPETPRSASGTAPRTRLEHTIAAIWSDVLQLPGVGIRDQFFDLGGHSLLLVKVHERLRREVDPSMSVVDLFQFPTVESLAEMLERKGVLRQ